MPAANFETFLEQFRREAPFLPSETARRLAEAMGARYVPLPYADAAAMSTAIRSAR